MGGNKNSRRFLDARAASAARLPFPAVRRNALPCPSKEKILAAKTPPRNIPPVNLHPAPLPLPPRAHPNPDLPALARALDLVLRNLMTLVAANFPILGRWAMPIWARLGSANRRLVRLLTRIANGTWRPAPKRNRAPGRPQGKPPVRLPTRKSFLFDALGYHCASYAGHLQLFLDHPDTSAALARAPGAIRTLRPLCRILGVTLPKPLDASPPIRRPVKPRAPRPPALPPIRWGPPPGLLPGGLAYRPSIIHPKSTRRRTAS